MYKATPILLTLIFALVMILGCSGKGNPITPENQDAALDSTPAIDLTILRSLQSDLGIMGAYELTINTDKMTAELVPMRNTEIGESFIVSGLNYFVTNPCTDCLILESIELIGSDIVLNFRAKHPFEKGDIGLPPSASNRLDLDIFDLALVIQPTSPVMLFNYTLTDVNVIANVVSNNSGYTRELSNFLLDESALPYVLVIDDSETGVGTWNKFEMGSDHEFSVAFSLIAAGEIFYDMYLTFGYGVSAIYEDRLEPKYYNPEFNRKAAWKVEITPLGVWMDNDDTTEVDVEVKVYDWQIGATVSTEEDFADADPSHVYAASEVESVSVEIPGMNSTLQTVTTPDSGSNEPDDPLIFTVPVTNENLFPPGIYTGLVKVMDERVPSPVTSDPPPPDILIDSPDGIELNYYTMPEYATYQTFDAHVSPHVITPDKLQWAVSEGGGKPDHGTAITTLVDDSIVVTGDFAGSIKFTANLLPFTPEGKREIFIAKYNSNGGYIWAEHAAEAVVSSGSVEAHGITALSDNSTVVTGTFNGRITFGPGDQNEVTLNASGGPDFFIARYDSDGSLEWVREAGDVYGSGDPWGNDSGNAITTLSDDSIVVTGDFSGYLRFMDPDPPPDPLPPEYLPYLKTTDLSGGMDVFIAKYDSEGNILWVESAGSDSYDVGCAITTLDGDSVVVTGHYKASAGDPAWFGSDPLHWIDAVFSLNIFIARLDASLDTEGIFVWAERAGGKGADEGLGITTLSDNSTVVTGYYGYMGDGSAGSAKFGLDDQNPLNPPTELFSTGNDDIFIARYDPDDGSYRWAKSAGGTGLDHGIGITTHSDDWTVVTGYFSDSAIFGQDEFYMTELNSAGSFGNKDIFIARYNRNGLLEWAESAGGTGDDEGLGIATLFADSTVLTGYFNDSEPTFGLGQINEEIFDSAGYSDIFIARYDQ